MSIENNKNLILGIETSCDETSVAVVANGREVLSNVVSSQIDIHKIYGGVVPEIASRNHVMNIKAVYDEAIRKAKVSMDSVDAIAVTKGPGLVGALLVGVSFAKGLALAYDKPIIGINHIEGHIASCYIDNPELKPPFIALIVSGGHTNLVFVSDYTKFKIYGKTHDDACGEAYDKIARTLGFEYPGGPKLEKAATKGVSGVFNFPRGEIKDNFYDFTFSGLKSHVINEIYHIKQKNNGNISTKEIANIACEFQNSIIDSLISRTIKLAVDSKIQNVIICGGVSANNAIKSALSEALNENNKKLYVPSKNYCTDNAAMIASAGYYEFIDGNVSDMTLNAIADLEFKDRG